MTHNSRIISHQYQPPSEQAGRKTYTDEERKAKLAAAAKRRRLMKELMPKSELVKNKHIAQQVCAIRAADGAAAANAASAATTAAAAHTVRLL